MECRDVRDRLHEHHEDLLGKDDSREIRAHLDRCDECRAILEEIEVARRILKDLDPVEAPPWLSTRIMARIGERSDEGRSLLSWLFRPFSLKIPLQAIGLIFVAALAFLVYRENSDRYDMRQDAGSRTKSLEKSEQFPSVTPEKPRTEIQLRPQMGAKTDAVLPPLQDKESAHSPSIRATEKSAAPEQETPSTVPTVPLQESDRKKEEKAPRRDERIERMKSFDESADSNTPRSAGGPAMERMAAPSAPAAPRIASGIGASQTVENLLRSAGATKIEKKIVPGKTIITAAIPADRLSQVSAVLAAQYRNARIYRSPDATTGEAPGYESVVIEIPDL